MDTHRIVSEGSKGQLRMRMFEKTFTPPPAQDVEEKGTSSEYEMYTDGSAMAHGAGWAFVLVKKDVEEKEGHGPVELRSSSNTFRGAEKATNNTGEITAILEGLRHLALHTNTEAEITIRYDSKYAANTTQGIYRAK